MILTIVATLASLQTSSYPSSPEWLSEVLSSRRAQSAQIKSKNRRLLVSRSDGPSEMPVYADRIVPGMLLRIVDHDAAGGDGQREILNERLSYIYSLELANDYKTASGAFQKLRREHPDWENPSIDGAILAEDLAGQTEKAYVDDVQVLIFKDNDRGFTPKEQNPLILSLIVSESGTVYAGQLEYCKTVLDRIAYTGKMWPSYRTNWDPTKPKDVAEASCLALYKLGAGVNPPSFLEEALKINPADKDVAQRLVSDYGLSRRYSDLRRIAKAVLRHIGNNSDSEFFKTVLNDVKDLPDGPRRPILLPKIG